MKSTTTEQLSGQNVYKSKKKLSDLYCINYFGDHGGSRKASKPVSAAIVACAPDLGLNSPVCIDCYKKLLDRKSVV